MTRPYLLASSLLTAVASLALAGPAAAEIPAAARNDPLFRLGYLVVTHYPGVRADGTGDSTAGIQQAIQDAFDNSVRGSLNYAVLFPVGTYVVGDTLRAYEYMFWNAANGAPNVPSIRAHRLIGATDASGRRPLIRLKSSAPRFDDAGQPRPLISFSIFLATSACGSSPAIPDDPLVGSPACFTRNYNNSLGDNDNFDLTFRGIDLDLGRHRGAIGVRFASAQGSEIRDSTIDATGAYAGVWGLTGESAGGVIDLKVIGGRYGLMIPRAPGGMAAIIGSTFVDQTESAIHHDGGSGALVFTGLEVRRSTPGAAIHVAPGGASGLSGGQTLSIIDARIETVGGGPAIENDGGKSLYLQNVSIKGTNALVSAPSGQASSTSDGGAWTLLREYGYADQRTYAQDPPYETSDVRFAAWNVIDGLKSKSTSVDVQRNAAAPAADLLTRHLFRGLVPVPTRQSSGAYAMPSDVRIIDPRLGLDDLDDTAALADAINGARRVFLPAGVYQISDTLHLRRDTLLFGPAQRLARIVPHTSWRPTDGGGTALIDTVDDRDATTALVDLMLIQNRTAARPYIFDHVHWRAGRRSVLKVNTLDDLLIQKNQTRNPLPLNPFHTFVFQGGGGGRAYFLATAGTPSEPSPWVRNTTQALTFYSPDFQGTARLEGASNVRFYSLFTENRNNPVIQLRGARNVGLHGMGGLGLSDPESAYLMISGDSANIVASNLHARKNFGTGGGTVREQITSTNNRLVRVDLPESVGLYRRGRLDDSMFRAASAPERGPAVWRTTSAVRIDGAVGDWAGVPTTSIPFTSAVLGATPASAADASATFRAQWDANNLYVLVEVRDQALVRGNAARYNNDSVEVYLDGRGERAQTYDANDAQVTIDLDGNLAGTRSAQQGVTRAVARVSGGYVVELSVPLRNLSIPATVGHRLGFDVGINDNDDNDAQRDSQLMWQGDDTAYRDPRQFGALSLAGAPQVGGALITGDADGVEGEVDQDPNVELTPEAGCSTTQSSPTTLAGLLALLAGWALGRRRARAARP